jgi:hypothetical protein
VKTTPTPSSACSRSGSTASSLLDEGKFVGNAAMLKAFEKLTPIYG